MNPFPTNCKQFIFQIMNLFCSIKFHDAVGHFAQDAAD
jgi:hypothetical protein